MKDLKKKQIEKPLVALVSMPWTTLLEPSLGLGILKASLNRAEIQNRIHHLNLFLLKYLSSRMYLTLGGTFAFNDFMFSYSLDPSFSENQGSYLSAIINRLYKSGQVDREKYPTKEKFKNTILHIREKVIPQYLEDCAEIVINKQQKPTLVGFSCLFDQTIASVALSRIIKKELPRALIVFGGYALEGTVGQQIIKSFPWIDAIAFGEGEHLIGSLAQASIDRSQLESIPGLHYRKEPNGDVIESLPRHPHIDLDTSPTPDFSDYAKDLATLSKEHKVSVKWNRLPLETSRGCWWGQKSHCVFCGIDDDSLHYRKKSPDKVLRSMDELSTNYNIDFFRISDYILPYDYFKTFLPKLALRNAPYAISCEIKANMDRDKMRLMSQAGIVEAQPGIESLSTAQLRKISKGVSAIRNIQTILQGKVYGIHIFYNILFGFPDDAISDYEEIISVIPKLYHLTPPVGSTRVQITRFSPLQSDPERFGINKDRLCYHRNYEMLFSESHRRKIGFDYDNFCYYFDHPYKNTNKLEELYQILQMQTDYWTLEQEKREVVLAHIINQNGIVFTDSRFSLEPETLEFGPEHAMVYKAIGNQINTRQSLFQSRNIPLTDKRIEEIISDFDKARVVHSEGNRIIGLSLHPDCNITGPHRVRFPAG